VLIHGGYWRSQWTRDTIDGLAVDLAARGWLTASIEYRRMDAGGGWPETGDDVLAAIHEVSGRKEAVPGSTVLIGHSAGGQLALWAAARSDVPLAGVIALAPVADLDEASRLGLGDGVVDRFLGGDPASAPDRFRDASPAAGPATGMPQVILHGAADDVVPVAISRRYTDAAAAAGADVTLIDPEGVGHDEVVDADHPSWQAAWEAMSVRLGSAPPPH
jgi:acetyl esterase/lipase